MPRRSDEVHVWNPATLLDHMHRERDVTNGPGSYKGMAMSQPKSASRVTPQSTGGFGSRSGVSNEPASAAMSVLLSWHEKLVEVAGLGCIGRTMTDWRRV